MNTRKIATGSALMALLAFGLIGAMSSNAFAQASGISVEMEKVSDTKIMLTGKTGASLVTDVTIQVVGPDERKVVYLGQIDHNTIINGEFMREISVADSWSADGWYTINVQQGGASIYKLKLDVEVRDGVIMTDFISDSTLEDTDIFDIQPRSDDAGLKVMVNAERGAMSFEVYGTTDRTEEITMIVKEPIRGNRIDVAQVSPNPDGTFSEVFNIGCEGSQQWENDGFYRIEVQQSENSLYRDSLEVEIIDCLVIPEFGTVAILVLAVAIVSIIAVTRTKFSVMPKF